MCVSLALIFCGTFRCLESALASRFNPQWHAWDFAKPAKLENMNIRTHSLSRWFACWLTLAARAGFGKEHHHSKGLKTLNCAICICNDLLHCIYRALALLHSFGSMRAILAMICSARCICEHVFMCAPAYIVCVMVSFGFIFLHIYYKTSIEC